MKFSPEPFNLRAIIYGTGRVFVCLTILVVPVRMLSSCKQEPAPQGPRYSEKLSGDNPTFRFAVHPLYNPAKLSSVYQPLMDYLDSRVPSAKFALEASRDYAHFEKKIQEDKLEFLLPNPWQTLEAMKSGYEVIAMAGDPEDFRGLIIVRRDSGIQKPTELKGKKVSYPAPTALAACIMPQYFLHTQGLNVMTDLENCYVGSQESSIMNVFLGQTSAGATWPPPWRAFQKDHPYEAAELKVMWETPSLISNSVMARKDLASRLKDQVRTALLSLPETPEGRAILAGMETRRFRAATDADYEVVHDYVVRFEKAVRPVKSK